MNERDIAWLRHQQQRWMRPDAHRWLRPDAARFLKPGTDPAAFFAAYQRKFNPNQPRVPKGNPDGGQWASEDGSSSSFEDVFNNDESDGGDAAFDNEIAPQTFLDILRDKEVEGRVQLVANNESENNFSSDRFLNQHIIDNHVGKTDDELKQRIRNERVNGLFVLLLRDRNGSFDSIESAKDFIQRTIANNSDKVSLVASGQSKREFLTWRFGYETGREAIQDTPDSEIRIRKTYNVGVVIGHDSRSDIGYRLISAYPRNYNPRIGQ